MRDDAGDPLIPAKIVDQRSRGLGRKASTLIKRQNRIPNLALSRSRRSAERTQRADQCPTPAWWNKAHVPRPAKLLRMLRKLRQQKIEDVRLPILQRPVRRNYTLNKFTKTAIAVLLRRQHLGRNRNQSKTRRNDIVAQGKGHFESPEQVDEAERRSSDGQLRSTTATDTLDSGNHRQTESLARKIGRVRITRPSCGGTESSMADDTHCDDRKNNRNGQDQANKHPAECVFEGTFGRRYSPSGLDLGGAGQHGIGCALDLISWNTHRTSAFTYRIPPHDSDTFADCG